MVEEAATAKRHQWTIPVPGQVWVRLQWSTERRQQAGTDTPTMPDPHDLMYGDPLALVGCCNSLCCLPLLQSIGT